MVNLPPALEQTLEAVLPLVTPMSPHWQCAPVDAVGPWTLATDGQWVDVTRSGDAVCLVVPVQDHLVLVARGTLSTLTELGPWMQGALKAQLGGHGRWQWEKSRRTAPWVVDRDIVWARLRRGDRLGAGIRGRCYSEYFLTDGALTRYLFDEGYSETKPIEEGAMVGDLAVDARDVRADAPSCGVGAIKT